MRKGQTLYRNEAIYWIPEGYNIPEVFANVTDKVVPGVLDYYMISNYGRLWHKYKAKFLNINVDSKGYLYKPLSTVSGKAINCRIHRLVMMTFSYFDGCENYLINHKDGNKQNPCIWNLEWCDYSDNAFHAALNGLNAYNRTPDTKVHEVCQLLEDPTIPIMRISDITGVAYTVIQAIQGKRTHTDISDQYNIKLRKVSNNLTLDEVRSLCQYYQDNKKGDGEIVDDYCARALTAIGYPNPNTRYVKTAKKIYWKETYWYISKDYNF